MPKEWRRFHKDSWVFNRVTIPFPNSHFAISSSASIVNYSMSSHEKKVRSNIHTHLPAPAGQCWPLISKCFPQGRIDLRLLPSLLQRQVPHKVLRQKLIFCRILEIWREDFFPQLSFSFLGRRLIFFLGRRYFSRRRLVSKSGEKMKFYILELFLSGDEAFKIYFISKIFLKKII